MQLLLHLIICSSEDDFFFDMFFLEMVAYRVLVETLVALSGGGEERRARNGGEEEHARNGGVEGRGGEEGRRPSSR